MGVVHVAMRTLAILILKPDSFSIHHPLQDILQSQFYPLSACLMQGCWCIPYAGWGPCYQGDQAPAAPSSLMGLLKSMPTILLVFLRSAKESMLGLEQGALDLMSAAAKIQSSCSRPDPLHHLSWSNGSLWDPPSYRKHRIGASTATEDKTFKAAVLGRNQYCLYWNASLQPQESFSSNRDFYCPLKWQTP